DQPLLQGHRRCRRRQRSVRRGRVRHGGGRIGDRDRHRRVGAGQRCVRAVRLCHGGRLQRGGRPGEFGGAGRDEPGLGRVLRGGRQRERGRRVRGDGDGCGGVCFRRWCDGGGCVVVRDGRGGDRGGRVRGCVRRPGGRGRCRVGGVGHRVVRLRRVRRGFGPGCERAGRGVVGIGRSGDGGG